MFASFKAKHPELDLPSGFGKKWTELEEQQLLNELEINMDHEDIAQNHSRTEGGIRSHINDMIYRMHTEGKPKEDIMKIMKVSEEQFNYTITCQSTKRENRQKRSEKTTETRCEKKSEIKPIIIAPPLQTEFDIIKSEITELKTDIKTIKSEVLSLKKMLKHLTLLMESVYEFENQAE